MATFFGNTSMKDIAVCVGQNGGDNLHRLAANVAFLLWLAGSGSYI